MTVRDLSNLFNKEAVLEFEPEVGQTIRTPNDKRKFRKYLDEEIIGDTEINDDGSIHFTCHS